MKQISRTLVTGLAVLAVLIVSIAGCAGTQTSAPATSHFSTKKGIACTRYCEVMVGEAGTASEREKCIYNCIQMPKEMYSSCE